MCTYYKFIFLLTLVFSSKVQAKECIQYLNDIKLDLEQLQVIEVLSASFLAVNSNPTIVKLKNKTISFEDIDVDQKEEIIRILTENMPSMIEFSKKPQWFSVEDGVVRARLQQVIRKLNAEKMAFGIDDIGIARFIRSNIDAIIQNASNIDMRPFYLDMFKMPQTYTPTILGSFSYLFLNAESYLLGSLLLYWTYKETRYAIRVLRGSRVPTLNDSYDFDLGRTNREDFLNSYL